MDRRADPRPRDDHPGPETRGDGGGRELRRQTGLERWPLLGPVYLGPSPPALRGCAAVAGRAPGTLGRRHRRTLRIMDYRPRTVSPIVALRSRMAATSLRSDEIWSRIFAERLRTSPSSSLPSDVIMMIPS